MEQYGTVADAILAQAGYNHGDVGHSVVDSDGYFVIDPKTKEVTGESKSITQFDHESEIISFKLPRYVEGHDMSVCTNVEVHYNNISTSRQENAGMYDVTDLAVMADDENMVQFTWLISENATQYEGLLSFLIMFKCERNGEVEYRWSTHINSSSLTVAKGMNNGSVIVAEYADILVQWEERLFSAENSAINNIEAKADETEARMTHFSEETYTDFENDVNKKMTTMTKHASDTFNNFNAGVDEKATETISLIPDDYTKLYNYISYVKSSADFWEFGDYYGAGDGSDIASTTRLRLKNGYIPNEVVQIDVSTDYRLMLYAYDKDNNYVGRWHETEGWVKNNVSQVTTININEFKDSYPDYRFKVVVGKKVGGDIDISAGSAVILKCIRWITSVELEELEKTLIEKIEAERISLDAEEIRSDNIVTPLEYGAIGATGTLSDESNTTGKVVRTTDYIEVTPDKKYTLYARYLQSGYNMAFYICCYDENKNFISRNLHGSGLNVSAGRYTQTFEIPEVTTKYIKLYFNSNEVNGVYPTWRLDGTDLMLSETEYAIPFSKNEGALEQINSIRVGAYDEHFDKVDEQISPKNKFWDGVLRESYATYAYAPRNTVESVKVAKELGFKYLKCDCRVTSDDVVVLCHDKTLDITTDYTGNGTIRDMTLEDVKACNIIQTRFSYNVKVATLDEFLHECKKYNVIPFVNLRDEYLDVVVPAVADLLIKYGFDKSAIVQSTDSSLSSLVKFRELNKKCLCMTVLTANTSVYAPTMEHLNRALSISDCGLIVHDNNGYITSHTEAFTAQSKVIIEEAHKHNVPVMYAIVSNKEIEQAVINIGYDGVMTSAVETVQECLLLKTPNGVVKKIQLDNSGNVITSNYMPVIS